MTQGSSVVFADTGYWIALVSPNDGLHPKARLAVTQYGIRRIITSDELVLVEFLDGMAGLGPYNRQKAVNAIKGIVANPDVDIVPMSTEQFADAVELYGSRLDHRWSLTDCASFLIMRNLGIHDALADDRDFRAAGFRTLLADY